MSGEKKRLYRVRFASGSELYEIYARAVYQGDLYGFVVVEDLVFGSRAGIVVDPSEERVKREFEGVPRTLVPMHAIVRIDEVERRGTAKVAALDGKVARFPAAVPPHLPDRPGE